MLPTGIWQVHKTPKKPLTTAKVDLVFDEFSLDIYCLLDGVTMPVMLIRKMRHIINDHLICVHIVLGFVMWAKNVCTSTNWCFYGPG